MDFDKRARELNNKLSMDAILRQHSPVETIAAALKAAWNDALEDAARMLRPSALYGDEFAKKLRAKKVP